MTTVLTIAGSDPTGGAGLQADLKAIEAMGLHGCSVVTCVTSQDTRGVHSVFPVPVEEIEAQLKAVLGDVRLGAVKTGMLYSGEIVRAVSKALRGEPVPIIVDPVMAATTGGSLSTEGLVDELRRSLLPIATLVTPNRHEAEMLSGIEIGDDRAAVKAARAIMKSGARSVLVKGGHLGDEEAVDYLVLKGRSVRISSPRDDRVVHGTGCALSSFIAARLAIGDGLEDAVRTSKEMTFKSIRGSRRVGRGVLCANPMAAAVSEARKPEMLAQIDAAAEALESLLDRRLIPEVGSNIGYCVDGALEASDVVALTGRIVRVGDRAQAVGCARFGASKHIARIVLAAHAHDGRVRCAMNVKYSTTAVSACRAARLSVASFDRAREPKGASSMTWGVTEAIRRHGGVPDVIFDRGGPGKEPMIRILGRDPRHVIKKLKAMSAKLKRG
ncbi:MAG: bifunctional hydroxymethylpyrimidine kinase/phosphomethylpyrimidine kinase [Methanobacteriota archaeon]|nr:MAG: bifunctional hydroxymethylpyrimidine kinase/phosphomethylpyrimidine kinase [Euryarchaeota archaeon]